MAAISFQIDDMRNTVNVITKYCNDLTEKFIKPARQSLEECGLSGDKKKKVDELAEQVNNILMNIVNNLGTPEESDTVMGVLKSVTDESNAYNNNNVDFNKLISEAAESATVKIPNGRRPKAKK